MPDQPVAGRWPALGPLEGQLGGGERRGGGGRVASGGVR